MDYKVIEAWMANAVERTETTVTTGKQLLYMDTLVGMTAFGDKYIRQEYADYVEGTEPVSKASEWERVTKFSENQGAWDNGATKYMEQLADNCIGLNTTDDSGNWLFGVWAYDSKSERFARYYNKQLTAILMQQGGPWQDNWIAPYGA